MSELFIYSIDNKKNISGIERQIYTETQMEAAAEGIFNALDKDLQKKYNPKQIFHLIKRSDKNKNGIITTEEAGVDHDNIFGLKPSEKTDRLEKIQKSVNKELELADIKSLQKGLETNKLIWPTAKQLITKNTTAVDLKKMFSKKATVEYYSEQMGTNNDTNKHLSELFIVKGISVEDIKAMGFSKDVLKDILRQYERQQS